MSSVGGGPALDFGLNRFGRRGRVSATMPSDMEMIRKTLGKEKQEENPLVRAFRLRNMVIELHAQTNDDDTGTHVRKYLGRSFLKSEDSDLRGEQ